MLQQNNAADGVTRYTVDFVNSCELEFDANGPTRANTGDGKQLFLMACINCTSPRCTSYLNDEYACDDIRNYSYRKESSVCAFGAIGWDRVTGELAIDKNRCVCCGICAARCPLGAIYFDGKEMVVHTKRDGHFYQALTSNPDYIPQQESVVQRAMQLEKSYDARQFDRLRIDRTYSLIHKKGPTNDEMLLFCRNLVIGSGFNCAIRRTGLVTTRIDAVYEGKSNKGAIEIEFGSDSLSTARNLLDDVAMMATRNNLEARCNTPIALFGYLPNTRQDYYQLCMDIDKVLGIRIRTLSIASLLLLMWGNKKLVFDGHSFVLGFRNASILKPVEHILGCAVQNYSDSSGYFEPIK